MSSSSTSNSNFMKLLLRAILFLIGLILSYAIIVFVLSIIPLRSSSLFKIIISDLSNTGGHGQTLKRFREVAKTGETDILFIGSSHSYRSFDPKIFARLGLTSINLGSSSQTPLNSFFLLEKYYQQISPKLVIFEIYPTVFGLDGLEGFYDLNANIEIDKYTWQMSKAVNHMHGYNSLAGQYLKSLFYPIKASKQAPLPNEKYVAGGYLHAEIVYREEYFGQHDDIIFNETQLKYLDKIMKFIESQNGKLLIVVAPLPQKRLDAITNYDTVSKQLHTIFSNNNILYYDFNSTLQLPTETYFRDDQHLNANGAKVFSYAVLDSLLDVTSLNNILDIQPKFASEIYAGRAITLVSQNKYELARIDFIKALSLDKNNYKALFNLGLIMSKENNFERSIFYYEKALQVDSTSFEVLYNQAMNYETTGQTKKASEYYQRCLLHLPPQATNYKKGILQKIQSLK